MNLVVIDTWPCNIFENAWKTGKLNPDMGDGDSDMGDGDGRYLFSALCTETAQASALRASSFAVHHPVKETLNPHPVHR